MIECQGAIIAQVNLVKQLWIEWILIKRQTIERRSTKNYCSMTYISRVGVFGNLAESTFLSTNIYKFKLFDKTNLGRHYKGDMSTKPQSGAAIRSCTAEIHFGYLYDRLRAKPH